MTSTKTKAAVCYNLWKDLKALFYSGISMFYISGEIDYSSRLPCSPSGQCQAFFSQIICITYIPVNAVYLTSTVFEEIKSQKPD